MARPVLSADLARWEPLCRKIAAKFQPPHGSGLTYEDLRQEARVGVWQALQGFDPARGATLHGFIAYCAERRVMDALTTARRMKHRPLLESVTALVSPDGEEAEPYELLPAPHTDPVEILGMRDELVELAGAIRERLSDRECAVLLGLLNGESYREMAARLGIREKAIDNARTRVLEKLRGERPVPQEGYQSGWLGYSCPSCGLPTRKLKRRGRPNRCNVCRVRR